MTPEDIEWMISRGTTEPGYWLVTLTDGVIAGTERFALHKTDIVSRGQPYKASWFDFEEPGDTDANPVVRAVIPNVNRLVGKALDEGRAGFTAHFELVRDSDLNRVVQAFRALRLRNAEVDHLVVTATLSAADYDNEPYAPLRVSPRDFPGLYLT